MLYIPPMTFRVCIVHNSSRRTHNDEVHTQICKILQETRRKQPGDDRPRLESIRLKFRNANKPDQQNNSLQNELQKNVLINPIVAALCPTVRLLCSVLCLDVSVKNVCWKIEIRVQ